MKSKMSKNYFVGFILFTIIWGVGFPFCAENNLKDSENTRTPKTAYDADFIHIWNNWTATAAAFEWVTGGGNYTDPYIIEDVIVNRNGHPQALFIQSSTEYFIIRNCTFYNAGVGPLAGNGGLCLYTATNGHIYNNTIYDCTKGMYLTNTENITIENNYFYSNQYYGIEMQNNATANVQYNNFTDNGCDVRIESSDNSNVSHNYFNSTTYTSINTRWGDNNTFYNNTMDHSGYHGISIDTSNNNNVSSNNMIAPGSGGISVNEGANTTVLWNNITNTMNEGIKVIGYASTDCNISHNRIINPRKEGLKVYDYASHLRFTDNYVNYSHLDGNPAIGLTDSHNITLIGNNISDSLDKAFRGDNASNILFENNIVSNTSNDHAIWLEKCNNSVFQYNNISETGYYGGSFSAFEIAHTQNLSIYETNLTNNNVNIHGSYVSNISIINNDFYNNTGADISFNYANHSKIINNTFDHGWGGMGGYYVLNATIVNNTISQLTDGAVWFLFDIINMTFTNNSINDCNNSGDITFYIDGVYNSTISSNNITNNMGGNLFTNMFNTTFEYNNIINHSGEGMKITNSAGNKILNNIITGNTYNINILDSNHTEIAFNDLRGGSITPFNESLTCVGNNIHDNNQYFVSLNIAVNYSTIVASQSIGFIGIIVGDNPFTLFEWNFDNGDPHQFTQNTVHQFLSPGTFDVKFNATDSNGDYNETTRQIIVQTDYIPVVNIFSNTTNYYAGRTVSFSANFTSGNPSFTFQWNFGDGSANSTSENPTHTYDSAGAMTVRFTIQDLDGDVVTDEMTFTVNLDTLPNATFTINSSLLIVGDFINFTYTHQSTGNLPLVYNWNFDSGRGTNYTVGPNPPIKQYNIPGNYTLLLTIQDASGDLSHYSIDIIVEFDSQPIAGLTTSTPTQVVDSVVMFADNTTSGNDPLSYFIDYGDGTNQTITNLNNMSHIFTKTGIFNVSYQVIDRNGDVSTFNLIITITGGGNTETSTGGAFPSLDPNYADIFSNPAFIAVLIAIIVVVLILGLFKVRSSRKNVGNKDRKKRSDGDSDQDSDQEDVDFKL
jgi:parallel beta-helix repeat protein